MRRAGARSAIGLVLAFAVLAVSMAVALGIGSVSISVPDVAGVVLRRLGLESLGLDFGVTRLEDRIVWQLRMPRVLGAASVGAALAVCGAVLQSLTRNDLADPYLLGISGGAAVGAVTVLVLGVSFAGYVGSAAVAFAAFVGAMVALILVLALAVGSRGELPPARLVLAGVAVGQVAGAYTSLLVMLSDQHDAARRVLAWTLGSVAGMRWNSALAVTVVALIGAVLFIALADHLDAFAFGETSARSLGVNVVRLRWLLFTITALVTAILVAYAGAVGFVGLIVPHMVRSIVGPRHRVLLPLSALVGAVLLVWADLGARTLVDGQEIPLGVVTAAVGAPFFAYLLRRHREAR